MTLDYMVHCTLSSVTRVYCIILLHVQTPICISDKNYFLEAELLEAESSCRHDLYVIQLKWFRM
jgi:hypothetical protein